MKNRTSEKTITYKINGGTSTGYVYGIKIKKVDEKVIPLNGAKFRITRKSNARTWEVDVLKNDEVLKSGLLRDDYKIQEIEAQKDYIKDNTIYEVNKNDFVNTNIKTLTITNKKEIVDLPSYVPNEAPNENVEIIRIPTDAPTESVKIVKIPAYGNIPAVTLKIIKTPRKRFNKNN